MEDYRRYDEPRYEEPRYEEPTYDEARFDDQHRFEASQGFEDPQHDRGPGPVDPPPRMPAAVPLPGEESSLPGRPPVAPVAPGAPVTPGTLAAPGAPRSPGPVGEGVYRSKRPAVAVLCGVPALLLELPALFLLQDGMFGDPPSASAVVAGVCLVVALPLLALGLYAVATGAVRAAGPNSVQAWLRPPVAYLSVALILVLAAGLAGT